MSWLSKVYSFQVCLLIKRGCTVKVVYNNLAYVTESVSENDISSDGDAHLGMVGDHLECRGQASQCTVSE